MGTNGSEGHLRGNVSVANKVHVPLQEPMFVGPFSDICSRTGLLSTQFSGQNTNPWSRTTTEAVTTARHVVTTISGDHAVVYSGDDSGDE